MQLRSEEWVGKRPSSDGTVYDDLGESTAAEIARTLLVANDRLNDLVEKFRRAQANTTSRFFSKFRLEHDVWIEMHARGLTGRYAQYERQDCENDAGRGEYLAKTIMEFYNTELTRARVLARLKE